MAKQKLATEEKFDPTNPFDDYLELMADSMNNFRRDRYGQGQPQPKPLTKNDIRKFIEPKLTQTYLAKKNKDGKLEFNDDMTPSQYAHLTAMTNNVVFAAVAKEIATNAPTPSPAQLAASAKETWSSLKSGSTANAVDYSALDLSNRGFASIDDNRDAYYNSVQAGTVNAVESLNPKEVTATLEEPETQHRPEPTAEILSTTTEEVKPVPSATTDKEETVEHEAVKTEDKEVEAKATGGMESDELSEEAKKDLKSFHQETTKNIFMQNKADGWKFENPKDEDGVPDHTTTIVTIPKFDDEGKPEMDKDGNPVTSQLEMHTDKDGNFTVKGDDFDAIAKTMKDGGFKEVSMSGTDDPNKQVEMIQAADKQGLVVNNVDWDKLKGLDGMEDTVKKLQESQKDKQDDLKADKGASTPATPT